MANGSPWYKVLISDFGAALSSELVIEAFKKFLHATGEKVAPEIGNAVNNWIRAQWPDSEDERIFNEALDLMRPVERGWLMDKLTDTTLNVDQNWYRIYNLCEDTDKMARIMTGHARMDDVRWKQYVDIMNLHKQQVDTLMAKFLAWLKSAGLAILKTIQLPNKALANSGLVDTAEKFRDGVKKGFFDNIW